MRQIGLTFLGRARTEGASYAPESVASMTTPLILISFFAIAAGWVGIPATFPVLGGIVPNWIEHFLEPYMEYMHLHAHHASFHVVPLAVSLLVALGGLGAGYLVYGKGLKEGRRIRSPVCSVQFGGCGTVNTGSTNFIKSRSFCSRCG